MNEFKKFYAMAMNAKLFMSIYFVAVVFITGVITAIGGGDSIRLLTLVEMLGLCMIIAAAQCLLLDDKTDYSRGILFGRSALWLLFSAGLTLVAALVFQWFSGLPGWCPYLLAVFMLIGLGAALMGLKFEQEADTVRLNEDLKRFQHKN